MCTSTLPLLTPSLPPPSPSGMLLPLPRSRSIIDHLFLQESNWLPSLQDLYASRTLRLERLWQTPPIPDINFLKHLLRQEAAVHQHHNVMPQCSWPHQKSLGPYCPMDTTRYINIKSPCLTCHVTLTQILIANVVTATAVSLSSPVFSCVFLSPVSPVFPCLSLCLFVAWLTSPGF